MTKVDILEARGEVTKGHTKRPLELLFSSHKNPHFEVTTPGQLRTFPAIENHRKPQILAINGKVRGAIEGHRMLKNAEKFGNYLRSLNGLFNGFKGAFQRVVQRVYLGGYPLTLGFF